MIHPRPKARRRGLLVLAASLFAVVPVTLAGSAYAQNLDCPAGGRGGTGGDAGRSTGGSGGLGFTVPGFGTTGDVDATGADGGSARGGTGGRGGSGTLPICNQNTNIAPAPARVAVAAPHAVTRHAAPAHGTGGGTTVVRGVGGGTLARTGSGSYAEIGLAGLALAFGGLLLYFGQPTRRPARR